MISQLTLVAAEAGSEEESAIQIGHHIEFDVERLDVQPRHDLGDLHRRRDRDRPRASSRVGS